MSYSKPGVSAVIFTAIFAMGCSDAAPTGVTSEASLPAASLRGGPSSLPNVFRFEGMVGGVVVVDPRTDLIAIDGLPVDPTELEECGGADEILNLGDFQVSGDLSGVLHLLAKAELNIHVYRLSTFVDVCTTPPLARGTGRLIINDNDAGVSGTRTNTFGHRLNGPVTLVGGGSAHLAAHSRLQIHPDGTFREVSSGVTLSQ